MSPLRVSAVIAASVMAIGLTGPVFGQADNTNSLIAPAPTPSYSQRNQYDAPANTREARTPYVNERTIADPYAGDRREGSVDSREGSRFRFSGPGISVGHDSNPNDYTHGIYNPKQ